MNPQLTPLIALASSFCLLAVLAEVLRIRSLPARKHLFLSSPLFLPAYAGGIFQWLLFGFASGEYWLLATCSVQLIALSTLAPQYVTERRR